MPANEQPASASKIPNGTPQKIQTEATVDKEKADKKKADKEYVTIRRSEQKAPKDYSEVAAMIFWGIFLAFIFGYRFFASDNQALVFLDASATQPLQVNGVVMFEGAPVTKGTVSLVFNDPKKNQYLAGKILPIGEDGRFETSGPELVALSGSEERPKATAKPAKSSKPLRVAVTFSGQRPGEKNDKAPKAVTGKATLYLNCSPPLSKRIIWGSIIVIFGVGTFLVILFTGPLTQGKARLLFSTSYIVIFLSLALPIYGILLVSKSPDAVELMQQAAIGLVKGTASTIPTPQWLVNLGGTVSPATKELPRGTEVSPPEEGLKTPLPEESVVPVSPNPAQEQSPILEGNGRTDETRFKVTGGLVVPFYVVFLAMLGAGIYMTKKVPDIQKRHDIESLQGDERTSLWSVMVSTFRAPGAVFKPTEARQKNEQETKTAFSIRQELIDNYMGLISAPFLAIAVYYLLQVIAKNPAEPVLVVVSFATGFISDPIVTAITTLGKGLIGTMEEKAKEKEAKEKEAKEKAKEKADKEKADKEKAQGESRQGESRQGESRQGESRQGESRQGESRQGESRQGESRQGESSFR